MAEIERQAAGGCLAVTLSECGREAEYAWGWIWSGIAILSGVTLRGEAFALVGARTGTAPSEKRFAA